MKPIDGQNLEEKIKALRESHKDLPSLDLLNQCLDLVREAPELALDEPYYGELVYQTSIPFEPKTKKNNQRILKNHKTGKHFIAQSVEYKHYSDSAKWFLRPLEIDYPVIIKCLFYRKTHQRIDITNLLSAISDILVEKRVIKDDSFNIVVGNDGSRVLVDKENPRTDIFIYKVKGVADGI